MSTTENASRQSADLRLDAEAARLAKIKLTDLFAADAQRVEKMSLDAPHLHADFSKQKLDDGALRALETFAQAKDFDGWREKLFAGEIVNPTEGRAAKHWALRDLEAHAEVRGVWEKMHAFGKEIAESGKFDAIIHLGIGGSDLGPRLVMDALKHERRKNLQVRFAANVDGGDVVDAIDGLDPARTLLIVVSKTFTTQETLANAQFVRAWKPARIAAATAAPKKAVAWGVAEPDVFEFWDWVGGRYSLWSSVGLCCEIALQDHVFQRMLGGAKTMDHHFKTAPIRQNLPAMAALVQHWNREQRGRGSYAMIPYCERMRLLPSYLQQLEMESNGKGVTRGGEKRTRPSSVVTWGTAGTNAQHSFFQQLHQGVEEIPVEFVVVEGAHEGPKDHRAKLFANALAQTRALMLGKSAETARKEMIANGMSENEASRLAPHRSFPGDRPSTLIGMDELSPEAFGALIAFYEHRTFTQGILADVNSFDQWGVELGKEMANQLAPALEAGPLPDGLDQSTQAWIKRLKR